MATVLKTSSKDIRIQHSSGAAFIALRTIVRMPVCPAKNDEPSDFLIPDPCVLLTCQSDFILKIDAMKLESIHIIE